MIKDANARNRAARERLRAVVTRLGERDVVLDDGWTAAAVLGHLAFWDRVAAARVVRYLRGGEGMEFFNDVLFDYINGAGLPQWARTSVGVAAADAMAAASATDQILERLSPSDLGKLQALARPELFDRSGHRKEHLDQIERALA